MASVISGNEAAPPLGHKARRVRRRGYNARTRNDPRRTGLESRREEEEPGLSSKYSDYVFDMHRLSIMYMSRFMFQLVLPVALVYLAGSTPLAPLLPHSTLTPIDNPFIALINEPDTPPSDSPSEEEKTTAPNNKKPTSSGPSPPTSEFTFTYPPPKSISTTSLSAANRPIVTPEKSYTSILKPSPPSPPSPEMPVPPPPTPAIRTAYSRPPFSPPSPPEDKVSRTGTLPPMKPITPKPTSFWPETAITTYDPSPRTKDRLSRFFPKFPSFSFRSDSNMSSPPNNNSSNPNNPNSSCTPANTNDGTKPVCIKQGCRNGVHACNCPINYPKCGSLAAASKQAWFTACAANRNFKEKKKPGTCWAGMDREECRKERMKRAQLAAERRAERQAEDVVGDKGVGEGGEKRKDGERGGGIEGGGTGVHDRCRSEDSNYSFAGGREKMEKKVRRRGNKSGDSGYGSCGDEVAGKSKRKGKSEDPWKIGTSSEDVDEGEWIMLKGKGVV